jgi:hypothetical protein
MIHHLSFAVRRPGPVAAVLAELTGASPFLAPSPPFPRDSWLLCFGDDKGSMIELLPWGTVLDPDAPLGFRQTHASAPRTACHALIRSPHRQAEVLGIARREGWRVQTVETGLFEIVKVWIDDGFLLEFLCLDQADRYVATFRGDGLPTLNAKLRHIETAMASRLAGKPEAVAAV